jgi:predicted RecA/RadA family phage recombinase
MSFILLATMLAALYFIGRMFMAEATFLYPAGEVQFTAGAAYSSGQVIQLADGRAGVISGLKAIASGDEACAQTAGIHRATKATATSFAAGDEVWWDNTTNTAAQAGDWYLGLAAKAATESETVVEVDLNVSAEGTRGLDDVVFFDDFQGASGALLTETGSLGVWDDTIVGAAPPTVAAKADAHGGVMAALLTATNEAQQACLHFGNQLGFELAKTKRFEARVSIPTLPTGSADLVIGLATDHNATRDSVASHAWFRLNGSGAVVVETDDSVADNDDVATGVTWVAATTKLLMIDLSDLADVKFYIDGVRVAAGTTFSMAGYTANLQPYIAAGKAAGTDVGGIEVDFVRVTAER